MGRKSRFFSYRLIPLVVFFTFLGSFTSWAFAEVPDRQETEIYLRGLMQEYGLPGLAVQVIDRQGIVWQITLGYRDVARQLPVTNQTLFAIGSTTKAFTGALLLQMQEQSLLDLDQPVQKFLPHFAVADARYSAGLTLRDLMTHSTGVGRHDLAWYHRPGTREELFALIPLLDMAAPPRSTFIYNNWMWMTAGMVAEKMAGQSWENLVRERIFRPLQMNSTVTSVSEVKQSLDYSQPYDVGALGANEIPFYELGAMAPAGGIYSNLNDLAQWVRFHLTEGAQISPPVLSRASLQESYQGVRAMGGRANYGLGWISVDFRGHRLLTHDGDIDGFASNISMIPEEGLGLVVLMGASSIAPEAIASRIWQKVLGLPVTDVVRDQAKERERQMQIEMEQYPDRPPISLASPRSEYVGRYCHPAYPEVKISEAPLNDELFLGLSGLRLTVYPVDRDVFSIRGQYNSHKMIHFERSPEGQVIRLFWGVESTIAGPLQFNRCPPD